MRRPATLPTVLTHPLTHVVYLCTPWLRAQASAAWEEERAHLEAKIRDLRAEIASGAERAKPASAKAAAPSAAPSKPKKEHKKARATPTPFPRPAAYPLAHCLLLSPRAPCPSLHAPCPPYPPPSPSLCKRHFTVTPPPPPSLPRTANSGPPPSLPLSHDPHPPPPPPPRVRCSATSTSTRSRACPWGSSCARHLSLRLAVSSTSSGSGILMVTVRLLGSVRRIYPPP